MNVIATEWTLPDWLPPLLSPLVICADEQARMQFVIALAERNVREATGGPFAAAVFDTGTGALVAAGVNRVIPCQCSHAHAEMVALAAAQRALGHFDLGQRPLELVTSCEPCAMCFGAIPWSGVHKVVSGARDADARAIGFDEGIKPTDWAEALRGRGIAVHTDVCRDEAIKVFALYQQLNGEIYNGTRSPPV